jgi:hypothetical protein
MQMDHIEKSIRSAAAGHALKIVSRRYAAGELEPIPLPWPAFLGEASFKKEVLPLVTNVVRVEAMSLRLKCLVALEKDTNPTCACIRR